jgi:ABC-type uncharacterized transport system ATPase subunit
MLWKREKAGSSPEPTAGRALGTAPLVEPDVQVALRQLTLSDAKRVAVPRGSVTVFVGPNNAGKTRALHDIWSHVATPRHESAAVVVDADISSSGSEEQLISWLDANTYREFTAGVGVA